MKAFSKFSSMPTIPIVKVSFDTYLKPHEIPAFRGAIIAMVGQEEVAFHNHLPDNRLVYAYPQIQYKSRGNKAEIFCIHGGVDEIHKVFSKNDGEISIGTNKRRLIVENIKINRYKVEIRDNLNSYGIVDWLPLNGINYQKYKLLDGVIEQIEFLEKILIGNILSFAKGIEWTINEKIEVKILQVPRTYPLYLKSKSIMAFDTRFKSNVNLPFDIGLGKGSSIGFGTIIKI
jgi:hypothetical protein